MNPRILEKYRKDVASALKERFGYKNIMAVPKIEKVIINIGVGKLSRDKDTKGIERITKDLSTIAGQKMVNRNAKQSIAGFKLREGTLVGLSVTLRGQRMYDFIDRLISIALPRSRDFQGISARSVDQNGNLNIGIRENNIFPEISYESLKDIFGFEITVVTSAKTAEEGRTLLKLIGFPIATS